MGLQELRAGRQFEIGGWQGGAVLLNLVDGWAQIELLEGMRGDGQRCAASLAGLLPCTHDSARIWSVTAVCTGGISPGRCELWRP